MTTHVFIVDNDTFATHLKYLFVGTGAKDKTIDFNGKEKTKLHHATERTLVGLMSDGARLRKGDYVIFYLQAFKGVEGRFYGIFKVDEDNCFVDSEGEALNPNGKLLLLRQKISPCEVYPIGVSEWEALDEIREISSPSQMLWSLIYRKLKGNRGNTMITIYEAERLFDLIRRKNKYTEPLQGKNLTYNKDELVISEEEGEGEGNSYNGKTPMNILPKLVKNFNDNKVHEVHLQAYIVQNIGKGENESLDLSLEINKENNIEWLGNEVSCGVGMQRIDIMISKIVSDREKVIMPIELKSIPVKDNTVNQLNRYICWIQQYYIPNRPSTIQPVLICKGTEGELTDKIKDSFKKFNELVKDICKKMIYIEYNVDKEKKISFKKIQY